MNQLPEKRVNYRRYEDRRLAMMFAVYKILFEDEPGRERDKKILAAVMDNFKADRAMMIDVDGKAALARVEVLAGRELPAGSNPAMQGDGFDILMDLHGSNPGALAFERVRKPDRFASALWDSLWNDTLDSSVQALLSIEIAPRRARRRLLWLQQLGSSREWGSRDRDLIEELAEVLAQAADKDLG